MASTGTMPTVTAWSFSPVRTAAAADRRVAATTPHPSIAGSGPPPCQPKIVADGPAELARLLGLQRHPKGGRYGEFFRSPHFVATDDGCGPRSAFTCIDFVLAGGEHSAWHHIASDEAWQLLEGGPLRLWLAPPALDRIECVELAVPMACKHRAM
jgi:hypothetical protein